MIWFATATAISLFTGRLTFALGVAVALGAVFAAQRGHRILAIVFAALTPLASPVAALFLACGVVAYAIAERSRRGLELAVVSVGMALLISAAFPEGGTEPFDFSSFEPAILVAIAVFVALPPEERLLRYGVAAYGAALTAAFLIQSPMGGNATRLGSLLLGPVLAFGLWRRQRFALVLLVPVLIYWQWSPVVRDLEEVSAQPSVSAGYYAPLVDFLRGTPHRDAHRVEVLPEAHHWESAYVPRGIYIARGWERQLDRKLNPLFYQSAPLTGPQYRSWLDDLGVGYVAVPHAPLDYAALGEKRLIKQGPPRYLERSSTSKNWTVYAVRDPVAARDRRQDGEADARRASWSTRARPGTVLVRVHWTPYWSIEQGTGCVEQAPGRLHDARRHDARAASGSASTSRPWRAISSGPRCHQEPVIQYGTAQSSAGHAARIARMGGSPLSADALRKLASCRAARSTSCFSSLLLAAAYWAWRHARGRRGRQHGRSPSPTPATWSAPSARSACCSSRACSTGPSAPAGPPRSRAGATRTCTSRAAA